METSQEVSKTLWEIQKVLETAAEEINYKKNKEERGKRNSKVDTGSKETPHGSQ